MESFRPSAFVRNVAERLVLEFSHAAAAQTPGLIGAAREHPARKQLERMLPAGAGVGTGIVIDSYGGVSKQQDVVIFERSLCPVFSINDTPEATFYPVEGVIAVGEVKSSLDGTRISDAFEKIASVRRLRRHAVREPSLVGLAVPFRHYGSSISAAGTPDEEFDQRKPSDSVFGFVLAGKIDTGPATFLEHVARLATAHGTMSPGTIVSLADGIVKGIANNGQMTNQLSEAAEVALLMDVDRGLLHLIQQIEEYVRVGRTVPASVFRRYFLVNPDQPDRFTIGHRVPIGR